MSNDRSFEKGFDIIRDAAVAIEATRNTQNHPVAVATFNDRFQHRFDANSRVARALETMHPQELAERLTGGTFFFGPNGQLIDFRDGNYHGFVHTDESIARLLQVIGYETNKGGGVSLRKVWSENGIEVPQYNEGGDFNSRLSFKWNPFQAHVNSAFELVRLICTNGMTGLTSFLNTKVPIINRWEEHLDIANQQIQNKVGAMVTARLGQMGIERATIAETQQIADHAFLRIKDGGQAMDSVARERLAKIQAIANPRTHLADVYHKNVFDDRRLGAQMPAHLNTFDVYNMATEIRSHTVETPSSTGHALDRMANGLVFDRQDLTAHAARFGQTPLSSFSDAERAFFGETDED